jgi:sulfoxide reductase heme-binding subunit YedZ
MTATLTSALWFLGRGTGVVALVLLTAAVALGILNRSGRSLPGLPRFGLADLHRTASLTAAGLVALHVTTLLFDPYAQLRVLDLVWPFQGQYRPVYLGLGTLALDLLLVVIATSLMRHRLGPRAFHSVHWAVYALWPLALLHGLGIGTDAPAAWFTALAAGCAGVVAAAVSWRIRPTFAERGHTRIIRETRPR